MIDNCQNSGTLADYEEQAAECERLARFCKALGHPARLQILHFLASVPTCFCGEIVRQLPLAQSTVSQHLKILKEAGLIQGEIEGPRTCYWLDHDALAHFRALVAQFP